MNDDSFPSLVVDEQLLFVALTALAEIEGREQPFELLNVIHEFAAQDEVAKRFGRAVGRAMTADDRDAIDYYVGATYLLHHHRANLDQLPEALEPLEPAAQQFVRTASWTFLQAWSLRYGGLYGRLAKHGSTLIDPSIDSVK